MPYQLSEGASVRITTQPMVRSPPGMRCEPHISSDAGHRIILQRAIDELRTRSAVE